MKFPTKSRPQNDQRLYHLEMYHLMLKILRPIYGRFNQYRGHSLRGRTIIKSIIPETKFETLTFKHFFPRLLKTFKHFDFTLRKDSFKTQVNLYLRENIKLFLNKFPKFDIKYSAYYRKKKKNLSKAKKARAKWGKFV